MLYNLMSPYLDSSVFFLRHITHIRHNCPCSIDQWKIYCTITSAVVINARRFQFLLVQVPLTWISLDIDDVANVNGELRSDDDDVTPLVSNEYSCIWDWDFTLATHNVCEPIEFLSSKRGLNLWDSIKLDYSCLSLFYVFVQFVHCHGYWTHCIFCIMKQSSNSNVWV